MVFSSRKKSITQGVGVTTGEEYGILARLLLQLLEGLRQWLFSKV